MIQCKNTSFSSGFVSVHCQKSFLPVRFGRPSVFSISIAASCSAIWNSFVILCIKKEELGCVVDITVVGQSLGQYLLCFSNDDPDFLIMRLIYLLGFTWRGGHSQMLHFSQGISLNIIINSPSENDVLYFVILWKMTNLALTAPSLHPSLLKTCCFHSSVHSCVASVRLLCSWIQINTFCPCFVKTLHSM